MLLHIWVMLLIEGEKKQIAEGCPQFGSSGTWLIVNGHQEMLFAGDLMKIGGIGPTVELGVIIVS